MNRKYGRARKRALPFRPCFLALISSAALLLGACTSASLRPGAEDPATVTTAVNLSGFPPEYKRGFSAGCAAMRERGATDPPKGAALFVQGWRDGAHYCSPRQPR